MLLFTMSIRAVCVLFLVSSHNCLVSDKLKQNSCERKTCRLLNNLAVMFLFTFAELLDSGKLAFNEKHALETT